MSRSNQTTTYKREPIRDPKHVMRFGKYKDNTIEHIAERDPQYLIYLHNNTDFELHADLLEAVEEAMQTWKP